MTNVDNSDTTYTNKHKDTPVADLDPELPLVKNCHFWFLTETGQQACGLLLGGGGMTPWYGVGGILPISFEVQRTIKRAQFGPRENSSWKYLSLIVDEQVISLQRTKVYVCSDSALCLGKMNENPQSNYAWEDRLTWFKSSPEYRTLDRIDGAPIEFEWNIFPGFTTLQLVREVQVFLSKMSTEPGDFSGRNIFMSMFNDQKTTRKNACQMPISFLYMRKDLE